MQDTNQNKQTKLMASTVFQGLSSPKLITEPNILIDHLSSPISNTSHSFYSVEEQTSKKEENASHSENNGGKMGGWNFIQTLCNTSNNTKQGETETEQVYVHPLVKRSSSTLSSRSLEMCTESLGSETGSDISENNEAFDSMLLETNKFSGTYLSKTRKVAKKVDFPPPLTSISRIDGVQVKPHREGGRLVLKAVALPLCNTFFQTERVDGRLRLSFLKGSDHENDSEESDTNEEELAVFEEEHNAVEAIFAFQEEKCNCKDIAGDEEDDDGSDGSSSSLEDEVKIESDEKVGCANEVGEFQWLNRCNGWNMEGMTNWWETYRQAIS